MDIPLRMRSMTTTRSRSFRRSEEGYLHSGQGLAFDGRKPVCALGISEELRRCLGANGLDRGWRKSRSQALTLTLGREPET